MNETTAKLLADLKSQLDATAEMERQLNEVDVENVSRVVLRNSLVNLRQPLGTIGTILPEVIATVENLAVRVETIAEQVKAIGAETVTTGGGPTDQDPPTGQPTGGD